MLPSHDRYNSNLGNAVLVCSETLLKLYSVGVGGVSQGEKIKNIKIFFLLYIYFELLAHPQEYGTLVEEKDDEPSLFNKKTNCLFLVMCARGHE